nr:immunoglobulin heavy chain junction region [Macaca mulatta]MOX60684.1 immunoglobulin heavy chain junction region [Macaca mulatta]MOX61330.1 immunoglobulin heavy chain junction region [Macaca mulatta]MOX61739.1 immunoglobulin heavy chain junction region [Macaca mulatta]MOX61948.1 immunoglobulin heavy chain junction region [Macaca mulatta]
CTRDAFGSGCDYW